MNLLILLMVLAYVGLAVVITISIVVTNKKRITLMDMILKEQSNHHEKMMNGLNGIIRLLEEQNDRSRSY